MKLIFFNNLKILYIIIFLCISQVICNDNLKILQITDIHYDPNYLENSPATCFPDYGLRCCNKYSISIPPHRKAGKYGDFNCDTSILFINETFKWISENIDFDVLLWTGDTVGHHDLSQSTEDNIKVIKEITDLIDFWFYRGTFGKLVVPVIGNHDTFPVDNMRSNFSETQVGQKLNEYWKEWIKDGEIYDNFLEGGYYEYKIKESNVTFLVLNMLYFDNNNLMERLDVFSEEPTKQLQWLTKKLQNEGKNVWIIGHIDPEDTTSNFTRDFPGIVEKYDNIKGTIWGHTHHDSFFLLGNKSFGLITSSLMADSVYPGFRVYEMNRRSGEMVNWVNYYNKLTKDNEEGIFNGYEESYNFLEYYEVDSYGYKNNYFFNLLEKLAGEMNDDRELFDKYYKKYYSNYYNSGNITSLCDDDCWKQMISDIRY